MQSNFFSDFSRVLAVATGWLLLGVTLKIRSKQNPADHLASTAGAALAIAAIYFLYVFSKVGLSWP